MVIKDMAPGATIVSIVRGSKEYPVFNSESIV